MPTIKRRSSLTANATDNPLVGSQYEFLPFDAMVQAAIYADTGVTVEATMFSGSDVLLENAQVDNLAVATPIRYPEDFTVSDVAAAGERLGLSVRETAGAAGPGIVRTVVVITPL